MLGDADGARAAYQRAIDSGHRQWMPAAMVGMAQMLQREGDAAGARAIYRQMISNGEPDPAAGATMCLGELLRMQGDATAARGAKEFSKESAS